MFKRDLQWLWNYILFILIFHKNFILSQNLMENALLQLVLNGGNPMSYLQSSVFFDGADFSQDLSGDVNIDNFDHGDVDGIYRVGSYMNTTELIERRGFKSESYKVETEDGYILSLTRIVPRKPGQYLPVYLQHGVLAASDQWLLLGRNKGLAFMLAELGFDIWLGDQRGNTYSRAHKQYQPTEPKFWDFSFHESGVYDLPAFILKIMEETHAPGISYIGHSMGTTVFLTMAAQRPEIAKLVRLSILLAPVCFPPKPSQSVAINMLLHNADRIVSSLIKMNQHEFLPRTQSMQNLVQRLCSPNMFVDVCLGLVGSVYGDNRRNLERSMVPLYFSSVPSGTSLKTMVHLVQVFRTGLFRQFNFGKTGNVYKYNTSVPPFYPLKSIETPIALIYGNNDGFVSRQSIRSLAKVLPNVVLTYEVIDPNFSHLDFMFGKDAKPLVFDKIVKLLAQYNRFT